MIMYSYIQKASCKIGLGFLFLVPEKPLFFSLTLFKHWHEGIPLGTTKHLYNDYDFDVICLIICSKYH